YDLLISSAARTGCKVLPRRPLAHGRPPHAAALRRRRGRAYGRGGRQARLGRGPAGHLGLLGGEEIRVAVIDPYPRFRQGIMQAIAQSLQLTLVAEGATLGDAERAVRERPDVLIFDIGLPDAGADGVQEFIKRGQTCKLVVLTSADDVASVSKALAA